VSDSGDALRLGHGEHLFEVGDATGLLDDGDAVGTAEGDPGRVVPPVLEALQARNENVQNGPGPDISNDATHGVLLAGGVTDTVCDEHVWEESGRGTLRRPERRMGGHANRLVCTARINWSALVPRRRDLCARSHLRVLAPDVTTVEGREGIRRILR
jgi:hypothetical protein